MEKHGSPPAYPGASGKAAAFPPQEAFRTRFASVSMHDGDKLRFLNFPTEIITLAVDLVNRFWPKGLQRQAPSYGSVELKLCGYPWRGSSSDAVHARRFLNRVLQHLFDAGWVLTCRTDISKVVYDLDTMLFRQQVPPPAQCEWMCISFSNGDEVRFIDAPEELVTQMVQSLGSMVQRREPHRGGLAGVHQIKLNA